MQITEWFENHGLKLNEGKTNILQFKLRNNVSDSVISDTKTVKYLGLTFDSKLSWADHVHFLNKKLSSTRYAIGILTKVASIEVCLTVYYAYVHSLLAYGVTLWGDSAEAGRVFICQKSILRTIFRLNKRTSCKPLFKNYSILTLPSIYIFEIAKFVHSNPSIFEKYKTNHNYHTRNNKKMLQYPIHSHKKFETGPLYMGLKIYNHLPDSYKDLPITKFNSKLKEALIEKVYYTVDLFFNDKLV